MLDSALRASGYRTGLYTSPHLVDVRERIRVDGRMIPREEFAALLDRARPFIDRATREVASLRPGVIGRRPTYFEVLTHVAFQCFAGRALDAAVLEVGMGGRLDATNVVTPVVSGITTVSLEHQRVLGDTVELIAAEKAGILKPGVPAVVGPQSPEGAGSIEAAARAVGAPLLRVGRDVILEPGVTGEGEAFAVRAPGGLYGGLEIPLWGMHQRENAAVAVGMLDALRGAGFDRLNPDSIRRGLREVSWPGRTQVVSERPTTVLDGAHNPSSIGALVRTISERFPGRRQVYVMAVAQDKDRRGMLRAMAPAASALFATRSDNPRAVDPEELARDALGEGVAGVRAEPDAMAALERAREAAGPDGVVVATGSLYLVGLILARVNGSSPVPDSRAA
jgi:dihydrofolate synthase/folylpolyglutamate synthase